MTETDTPDLTPKTKTAFNFLLIALGGVVMTLRYLNKLFKINPVLNIALIAIAFV